jgi:hypothetical protein
VSAIEEIAGSRERRELAMRQVLANLELLMHGTTTNFSSEGGGDGAGTKQPTGELHPPHLLWRERWEQAASDDARRRVLENAKADLESYRKGTKSTVEGMNWEELLLADGAGHSPEMVGQHYKLSPHHVRRIRKRHDRGTEDGLELKPKDKQESGTEKLAADKRRAEVVRMKATSMSNRQIAFILGCDEITIRRDVQALRTTS